MGEYTELALEGAFAIIGVCVFIVTLPVALPLAGLGWLVRWMRGSA